MDTLEVMKYLGGAAVFGRAPRNSLELEAQLRHGLPVRSFVAFKQWARLSNDELASIADISPKTLQRYFKLSIRALIEPAIRGVIEPVQGVDFVISNR